MALGDLGAEIWKIENPAGGDETRSWTPPAFHGTATYYLAVNRNKSSLAVDFRTKDGQDRQEVMFIDCSCFGKGAEGFFQLSASM